MISLAGYERVQVQSERIAKPEHQVESLAEVIRLSRQKRFGASSSHSALRFSVLENGLNST